MARWEGFQELVALFDASGSTIGQEMRFGQFNGLLAQKASLKSHSASTVKAAYAQVGAGLTVHAVVFFLFKVNEEGYVDPAFNLPLAYMADNAGEGPDLGNGPISMACRSQCPVPWHAINMWEPAGKGEAHPAMQMQKLVWRNRLGLKPAPVTEKAERVAKPRTRPPQEVREVAAVVQVDEAVQGAPMVAKMQAMEQKLTATFGEAGRVSVGQYTRQHREQVGQVAARFRQEMERQQQGYLEQIKSCREEIQKLKSALRNEKQRSRRLQQLLRGDV